MNEQLIPCPHCAGENIVKGPRPFGPGVVITCHTCTGRIWGGSEEEAIAAWNRRAPGRATKAMLEWIDEHPVLARHPTLQEFKAEWK